MSKLGKKLIAAAKEPNKCLTDKQAARYVAHTHPLTQQSDEKPEDFVLRIVYAYDWVKDNIK